MLGLPVKFLSTSAGGGVIQDSDSSAALCTMLAARERTTHYASNEQGNDGRLVAYTSSQAHSSIEKAVKVAGIGRQNLRLIEVDDKFAMRPDALAREFAAWIKKDDRFEVVLSPPLNLVCFRHRGGDDINQNLMDRLNRSGDLYLTHTMMHDRLTFRLCVGQTHTRRRHVMNAWRKIQDIAAELEK